MKIKAASVFIIFLFITCSKKNNKDQAITGSQNKATIIIDTTNKIPLNDLGKHTYQGDTGGLYPHGKNNPTGTYASDLSKICSNMSPLDSFGNVDEHGRVLFISLGGSTCGHNMRALKDMTVNNPRTNSKLILLNCCTGSGDASLNSIMNPLDTYWDHVRQIVQGSGGSYRQVQIIYLESDDSSISVKWPSRPNLVKADLEICLRNFKQTFPNIKLVYVLGRTHTFGYLAQWNTEPAPYWMGWACKWAIEDQINGVPGTEYKGKKAVAPMLTWGFYQWADSTPRKTDGFHWQESYTRDGLHANDQYQDTLALRFQNFLLTDKYAKKWYAAQP